MDVKVRFELSIYVSQNFKGGNIVLLSIETKNYNHVLSTLKFML
jgi:hypothetical protein